MARAGGAATVGQSVIEGPTGLRPVVARSGTQSLDEAIDRGRRMVLDRQRSDGSWQERGDMGPFTTALSLVALRHVGHLPDDDAREGARWLRGRQLADGSFPGRPFADEGDLSTTAACWAALTLSGRSEDDAAATRARARLEELGGIDAVVALAPSGDVVAVVLAMAGLLEPERVPAVPLSVVLVPRLVETVARRAVFRGRPRSGRLGGPCRPEGAPRPRRGPRAPAPTRPRW